MFDRRVTRRSARRGQATLLCLLVLAGCSAVERLNASKLSAETPIDWWHDLQGGRIARDRPPPPGVNDPYPSLRDVPARPTPTDAGTRRALTAQLAGERDRTERAAARDPIIAPAAAPAKVAPPKAAPAADEAEPSKAVFDGANAPAPPPAARRPTRPAATPVPTNGMSPPAPVESGPLPELPASAPAIPRLPGLPASAFAPAAPRPLPQAVVTFARGSATLPDSADPALRALAARLAGGGMVVEAGGDADSAAPDAQAAAMPLGLARARSIQAGLQAAGVPPAAIRIEAAGLGRTGIARLLP